MRILFCDSGFSSKEVDYMYVEEYQSAKKEGIRTSLISFEELKKGNVKIALKRVALSEEKELGLYRGWMLKPNQYDLLYHSLLEKNIQLINTPEEYKFCHYLPESYEVIKEFTPKTTFKKLVGVFNVEDFLNELNTFDKQAIIIKDYVKSQKHYWEETCFIPNASDKRKVESVIERFIELQDVDLNEGLVFREFVELEELTNHSKSGMPLTKEFRVFVKDKKVIAKYPYWDEGNYQDIEPVLDEFVGVIQNISSNFFTRNDG